MSEKLLLPLLSLLIALFCLGVAGWTVASHQEFSMDGLLLILLCLVLALIFGLGARSLVPSKPAGKGKEEKK